MIQEHLWLDRIQECPVGLEEGCATMRQEKGISLNEVTVRCGLDDTAFRSAPGDLRKAAQQWAREK